jgi:hypothetical protein
MLLILPVAFAILIFRAMRTRTALLVQLGSTWWLENVKNATEDQTVEPAITLTPTNALHASEDSS